MVVATTEIQGGEYFCTTKLGKHFIYLQQWVQAHASSGTRVNFNLQGIDTVIIYTHPPLGGSPGPDFFGTMTIGLVHGLRLFSMTPAHSSCSISFLTQSWCFNGRVYGL